MESAIYTPYVIEETKDFAAIYKPPLYHSVIGKREPSLAKWILSEVPFETSLRAPPDCGLLQRLDFETSGVILAAKNPAFAKEFLYQQSGNVVQKRYLAVLEGRLKTSSIVSLPIGTRGRSSARVLVGEGRGRESRSLPAKTSLVPLTYSEKNSVTLVMATITKGLRHQIRAHSAALGFPLLGDSLYGATRGVGALGTSIESPSFFLHAESLSFGAPPDGALHTISAPIPPYFQEPFSISTEKLLSLMGEGS